MKTFYSYTKNTVAILATVLLMLAFGADKANAQMLCGAGFSYYVAPGGVVTFYDSSYVSGGTVTSGTWTFGDGTSGTGTQITHTYNGTGPYVVCYFITTSVGCSDSTCMSINLTPCTLVATLAYDSLAGTLTANASGGTAPYTYQWSNGANTSTISGLSPGTYCCNVVDANGCSQYVCYTIGGSGSCYAYFSYNQNPSSGSVNFYGSFSGTYASVLWDFGDGSTSTQLNPIHTYANPGTYTVCVSTITFLGTVCTTYCNTVVVNSSTANSVICGTVFNDPNANGVMDGTETGIANTVVYIYGNGMQISATTDSNGMYNLNLAAGTYFVYYCTQFPNSLTVPNDSGGCGFYTVTVGPNDTICGFNFGVAQNSVIISGKVFNDANSNGIFDGGEFGIPYQAVQVGTQWVYTDGNGDYSIYRPTGTYNVSYTPTGVYAPYALTTPGTISVAATNAGLTYGNNNFGILIPPGTVNLSVNLNPHTTVTPGFPAWYDIQVNNVGVMPVAATLTMVYDAGLTLNWGSPAPASNNTVTHTLTWNLPVIANGNSQYIWVDFDADPGYVIGANTLESAFVTPTSGTDIDMNNNLDTVHQFVTGSWDPNNKLVISTNNINPNYQIVSSVNPDQSIEYTINFQNLGNAPAQNIVVIDELSSDLDWSSYQLTGASHNVNVSRNGNVVTYQFIGIQLPDATTNEPQSHGFVAFSINSNTGLAAGHQISDFANIYFDFNAPVTTNNAVITLISASGINDSKGNATVVSSYPNPVSDFATLQFDLKGKSTVTIDVIDATGHISSQLVNTQMSSGIQKVNFDASNLSNGIYTLRLTVDGKTSYTKVSVSH
jgi:uncharacterized repeat protein (TIGR01451 family)